MKVSVKIDKRAADRQGRFPLKVTISQGGETAHIPIGISVYPNQWDKKLGKIVKHPQAAALNLTIEQRLFDYRQRATDFCLRSRAAGYTPTAIEIRDIVSGATDMPTPTILAVYERFLPTRSGNTLASYTQTFRKVAQFVGPDDLPLDDVTVGWLEDFDDYLKRGGLAVNSRAVHHRNLRVLLNYALDHNLTTTYPYRRFRIPTKPTPHLALSLEDFRRVATAELPPNLARWRDVFVLSFCFAGMNLIDMAALTPQNIQGNRLRYTRSKTHHPFDIILTNQAAALIRRLNDFVLAGSTSSPQNTSSPKKCHSDKFVPLSLFRNYADSAITQPHPADYLIPPAGGSHYRSRAKRLNAALRRIAEHLSIPPFSFYAARHTFASVAALLQVPHDTIAELLGHARTVTDIYIRVDTRLADDALTRITQAALPTE